MQKGSLIVAYGAFFVVVLKLKNASFQAKGTKSTLFHAYGQSGPRTLGLGRGRKIGKVFFFSQRKSFECDTSCWC